MDERAATPTWIQNEHAAYQRIEQTIQDAPIKGEA
jgi:hypothetical protein